MLKYYKVGVQGMDIEELKDLLGSEDVEELYFRE